MKDEKSTYDIVFQPYHQIQAEFMAIMNRDRIFRFLSLNSKNPEAKKLVLCTGE